MAQQRRPDRRQHDELDEQRDLAAEENLEVPEHDPERKRCVDKREAQADAAQERRLGL